jgi:transposase
MLVPLKPRRLDDPVSLEDLVPRGHVYRHLDATLDLGFVREWARKPYAERGLPSIDPVVFFKLQLVVFFEGLRSERKLVETASGYGRPTGGGAVPASASASSGSSVRPAS